MRESADELYYWFLVAAVAMAGIGLLALRKRAELMVALGCGIVAAIAIRPLLF